MAILHFMQYLARQGIPLRGHGSDEDSNFFQLLMMKSKEFPELKTWLEKKQVCNSRCPKRNHKHHVQFCLAKPIKENRGQLTFCLRWVEALKAHETFIGVYEIPDIKSSTIVSVIKDILTRYQLSMENFRDHCYDGASNMLGKTSGVAVELQKLQTKANYTHCHAHSLSLSVKDVNKKLKFLGDTMGTAREIIVLSTHRKEKTSWEKSKNKSNVMKKWKSK